MQVFKTYFRLLNSYKGIIILYVVIFMGVSIILSGSVSGSGKREEAFVAERLDISIIDRDDGVFAKGLTDYFKTEHDIVDLEDDEDAVLNELYWREVDYVIVIPKGFEESLEDKENKAMELNCMKVPGSFDSSFFEAELTMYLSKLAGLMESGESLSEAFDTMLNIRDEKAEVTMASFVNENQGDRVTMFFQFVPYLFITLGITGVGMVLLTFNKKEVKDRMECAPTPLRSRIGGMSGGILVFGAGLFILVLVVAVILTNGEVVKDSRTPYFMLNMFSMLLFSLSLGFLTGTVAKNNNAISGINNIVSLGLCFIGGVMVPQEFFGDSVLKVAKFFPTYWYVKTNSDISKMASMTDTLAKDIRNQVLVVLAYAVVIFALTTVVISGKRKSAA